MKNFLLFLSLFFIVVLLTSCTSRQGNASVVQVRSMPDGNVTQGRSYLEAWGCGACHHIPGVKDANSYVGPPLDTFGKQSYIAGKLENTPDNLIHWIMDPQGVDPGNAMPNMNVPESVARDMGAYLYSLASK